MLPASRQAASRKMGGTSALVAVSLQGVFSVKGVWRCDSILGGSPYSRLIICRHWNVHNGNRACPARIDVHCLRCGSRHQHVPNPRDTRGRRSRMRYVLFPHDVAIDILVDDCARRNRNGEQLSNEFVQASTLIDSSEKDDILAVERSDLGPPGFEPGSVLPQIEPDNVNESPRLIMRVWRRIVTFFRRTSL